MLRCWGETERDRLETGAWLRLKGITRNSDQGSVEWTKSPVEGGWWVLVLGGDVNGWIVNVAKIILDGNLPPRLSLRWSSRRVVRVVRVLRSGISSFSSLLLLPHHPRPKGKSVSLAFIDAEAQFEALDLSLDGKLMVEVKNEGTLQQKKTSPE